LVSRTKTFFIEEKQIKERREWGEREATAQP